jgi:hypothetical protein
MARFRRKKRALLINRATSRVKRVFFGGACWLLKGSFAAVSLVDPNFGVFRGCKTVFLTRLELTSFVCFVEVVSVSNNF